MKRGGDYNIEWFRKRAFDSLSPITPHVWDYSDSLLLYMPSGVKKYESIQNTDTPYFKLITKPEKDYLTSIAGDVVGMLPDTFDYIDLGPGTEHKEQPFFDECRKQGKTFTYVPVDISEYYLDLAVENAFSQNIPVNPIQSSFEELSEILGPSSRPRFVNIGLTFSNHEPQKVFALLKGIAGEGGFFFINSQIKDRVNMSELQKIYAKDAVSITDNTLELLDLNPSTDVSPRETTGDIKAWCSVINPSQKLKDKGIVEGDRLLVFQSLRYTPEGLEKEIQKTFSEYYLYDRGSSFIAALIKA